MIWISKIYCAFFNMNNWNEIISSQDCTETWWILISFKEHIYVTWSNLYVFVGAIICFYLLWEHCHSRFQLFKFTISWFFVKHPQRYGSWKITNWVIWFLITKGGIKLWQTDQQTRNVRQFGCNNVSLYTFCIVCEFGKMSNTKKYEFVCLSNSNTSLSKPNLLIFGVMSLEIDSISWFWF